jgi:hypothetical protein
VPIAAWTKSIGCVSLALHRSIDGRRIALASVSCSEPDKGQGFSVWDHYPAVARQ